MNDKQMKIYVEFGAELGLDADTVMEVITAQNYCDGLRECDSCDEDIRGAIQYRSDVIRLKEQARALALDPCPFCGSNDTKLDKDQEGGQYNPRCIRCKASGGWFKYPKEAAETWNNAAELVERDRDS